MRWIAASLVGLALAGHAAAQDAARLAAFHEGRFLAAATGLDTTVQSADEAAFAARAVLAACMTGDTDPEPDLLTVAERHAERALALDPAHVEGRLQLAIAKSLILRPMSVREARRSGLGDDVRAIAESVIADDPANAYAHGLLSVWHIEVRRRGGVLGASIMGASVERGRRHYAAAVASQPGDAALHWQYARALAALNARRYRPEIEAALDAALAVETRDALQAVMVERAGRLAEALEAEPPRKVEALAEDML